ncbi:unnamed protein product [Heterobilharzia americana]|nr:unnamed protein product [Heterobilharzia americana]CAH8437891.1 unnamed protein product [Heterobilharzia americana]
MDIRVRLRPWLESRLNDGWIEGLKWIDKDKGIFRIPWKHHSKHTWTEEDAAIFKDWAVVTGRYREGIDIPDWPMWKTRLRCALNKAPDIQEVKQRHNLHCEEPFKVYRFVSKTESLWRANAIRNASMIFDGLPVTCRFTSPSSLNTNSHASPSFHPSKRHALIVQKLPALGSGSRQFTLVRRGDGVLMKQLQSSTYRPAHVLQGQQLNPYRICHSSANRASNQSLRCYGELNVDNYLSMQPSSYVDSQITNSTANLTGAVSHSTRFIPGVSPVNQFVQLLPDIMEPEYHQLAVRIQHLSVRVRDAIVTNPNGCCIYYGRFDEITSPAAPDPIEAQIPHQISVANKAYVDLLLDNMIRGIILTVVHRSIYAERICKCAVFVYIPTGSGEYVLIKKLGRRLKEKIFDYDQFLFHLESYRQNQLSRPHFEVILAFGQQLKPGISTDSLLIWSRVASCRAWFQLNKAHSLPSSSYDATSHNVSLNSSARTSVYHRSNENSEQGDYVVSNHFPGNQTVNGCNGYNDIQAVVKTEEIDPINEHVSTISFADALDPDSIVTEQIIEEGVEVPLDDTEDLTYGASSSVMQENLIVCDSSQDVSSVPVCTPSSSVNQDIFLSSVDSIDLKSHILPCVHDGITVNFRSHSKE